MTEALRFLIQKYAAKGILVDTNILLMYFVGTLNRDRIARFKRTDRFDSSDYDLLVRLIASFNSVVTTPNVLTEVSSFINQLGEPDRSGCYQIFASKVAAMQEHYLPTRDVVSTDWSFTQYGLVDCGIAALARNGYLVLTDDLRMASYLFGQGIDTINFNHLRE